MLLVSLKLSILDSVSSDSPQFQNFSKLFFISAGEKNFSSEKIWSDIQIFEQISDRNFTCFCQYLENIQKKTNFNLKKSLQTAIFHSRISDTHKFLSRGKF